MNILQIISGETWSGGQFQVKEIIKGLTNKGHKVFLACREKSLLGKEMKAQGFRVFHLRLRKQFDIITILKINRIIKENKIDIVNTHRSCEQTLCIVAKLLNPNFKLVVSRRVFFPLKTNFFSKLKYCSSKIDSYIAVSKAVKNELIKADVLKNKIKVIYSGTNFNDFKINDQNIIRKELNIPENAKVIGIVANYSYYKGHTFFIEAMNRICKIFKDCHIILAGSETDLKELKQLAEFKNKTHFLGFRNDPENIINSLDILVSPSLQEGLAGTIREAMALKKPVVATNVGGNPEIVINNETGILVEPENSNDIYKACKFILENNDIAIKFGENGKKQVEKLFSVDKMLNETEKLYSSLL